MARGLSNLQQFILHRAAKLNRVYYADILENYFRLTPNVPIERFIEKPKVEQSGGVIKIELPPSAGLAGQIISPKQRYFSPARVGKHNYNKAMASLSRSCGRLESRGLIRQRKVGRKPYLQITAEGVAWVKEEDRLKQQHPEKPAYDRIRNVLTNKYRKS